METNDHKTLRDEFAMAALPLFEKQLKSLFDSDVNDALRSIYAIADAMMKQRNK